MMKSDSRTLTVLEETTKEKDLGIWMSETLNASSHVAHAVSKGNQILGLIRRTFTYMDCELMKQLFTSLVRPHLEYGNVVWHPYLKKDIDMLESVQHRATRMVAGLAKLSYTDRLMNLPSLVYRRNRGDAIEVYKYLHGICDVDSTDILPRHTACAMTTTGHSLKLRKTDCRGSIRANFFGVRVVNLWNSLPEELVSSATVNCFKGRFDRHSLGNRFSEEWIMGLFFRQARNC